MTPIAWAWQPYEAAFAHPIPTRRGPWLVRRGYWVVAAGPDGQLGLGEVAPLPDWGSEDHAAAEQALARLQPCHCANLAELPAALAAAGLDRAATPAAYAGVELALLDWLARHSERRLAELLAPGQAVRDRVAVSALIGAIAPAEAAAMADARVAEGYTTIKLKLDGDAAADLARARAVRTAIGPGVALRLDANGAWPEAQAREVLAQLGTLAPSYVEQPTPADDPAALGRVRRATGVAVAADEAAHGPAGLAASLAAGIDAVVLKPFALGGLLATREAIGRARAAGVTVTLSSVMDRGVASAGALHLAAGCAEPSASGLATAGLFAAGPALEGLLPVAGAIALPSAAGLGFVPRDAGLVAWLKERP